MGVPRKCRQTSILNLVDQEVAAGAHQARSGKNARNSVRISHNRMLEVWFTESMIRQHRREQTGKSSEQNQNNSFCSAIA